LSVLQHAAASKGKGRRIDEARDYASRMRNVRLNGEGQTKNK